MDREVVKQMLKVLLGHAEPPSPDQIAAFEHDPAVFRPRSETNPLRGQIADAQNNADPGLPCAFPTDPPCAEVPIASHSIQRGGPLSYLADAGSRVILLATRLSFEERPVARGQLVPISKATTFPGLCSTHDTELFLPIDRPLLAPVSDEQNLLLAYRAFLRERYHVVRRYEAAKRLARVANADAGGSPESKLAAIAYAYEMHKGEWSFTVMKEVLDKMVRRKASVRVLRFIERWVRPLDFTVSGFCSPFHDLQGKPIPNRGEKSPLPFLTVNVVPAASGTFISIGVPVAFERELGSLVADLESPATDDQFIDKVWALTLRNLENVAVRPATWDGLPPERRNAIERLFNGNMNGRWTEATPDEIRLAL